VRSRTYDTLPSTACSPTTARLHSLGGRCQLQPECVECVESKYRAKDGARRAPRRGGGSARARTEDIYLYTNDIG
jgi:hypothetical protein